MGLGRVSRCSRAMFRAAAFGLALVFLACYPASGSATEVVLFPLGETSGSLEMLAGFPALVGVAGGGGISTPEGDAVTFNFIAPFGIRSNHGASVSANQIDALFVGFTHAGQSYSGCPSFPLPPGLPPGSMVCAFLPFSDFTISGDPPPFTGDPTVTVQGHFGMNLVATVSISGIGIFSDQNLQGSFVRSGPATLTFNWHPEIGDWLFSSGSAQIDPIPEPATLLLFGSTLGALGIFRKAQHRKRDSPQSRRVVD
jgi:hypothetical protein